MAPPVDTIETPEQESHSLAYELESFSGWFRGCENYPDGFVFSNDRRALRVYPELRERFADRPTEGVGLFVGPGGMASLLPELPIKTSVTIDRNHFTVESSRALRELIIEQAAELSVVSGPESEERYIEICKRMMPALVERMKGSGFSVQPIIQWGLGALYEEAWSHREYHWSQPDRIQQVAENLAAVEPSFMQASLTDAWFQETFIRICREHDEEIVFANFTNVHEWIKNAGNGSMDFLRRFPFADDAAIVFSVDTRSCTDLETRIASSLDEYLAVTDEMSED